MASLVNMNSCISIVKPHPQAFYLKTQFLSLLNTTTTSSRLSVGKFLVKPKATLEENPPLSTTTTTTDGDVFLQEEGEESDDDSTKGGVEESVKVLKEAAKTRKVKKEEVLDALSVIKKAKNLDPSGFLDILAGTESPGRTWMLIFTAQDRLKRGYYFPITAVQQFDAAARRIENGVYLGQIGYLTFEGRFSWKKRILAFIFEFLKVKVGPFGPLKISLGSQNDEEREPSTKDPFFIWFYVDEEIAVAQGRGGGTAFWCRCRRVTT